MGFSFQVPTNFVFGQGAVKKLHKQRLPGKKALIVISSGKSTRANGYLDTVQDQLTQAGVAFAVFDKILANPTARPSPERTAVTSSSAWAAAAALTRPKPSP